MKANKTRQTVYRIIKEHYAPPKIPRTPLPSSLRLLQRRRPLKSFKEVTSSAGSKGFQLSGKKSTTVISAPTLDQSANKLTQTILKSHNRSKKQLESLASPTNSMDGNIATFDPLLRKKPIRRNKPNTIARGVTNAFKSNKPKTNPGGIVGGCDGGGGD